MDSSESKFHFFFEEKLPILFVVEELIVLKL